MAKEKIKSLFWKADTGKKVIKSATKGTKVVIGACVAGLALGLGLSAFNSTSS